MAKRYRFTARDGKRYTWSAAELEDTIFESEAWGSKATQAKAKALKVGQRMTRKGETLERLGSNPAGERIKPGVQAAKTARRALELRRELPEHRRPATRAGMAMANRIAKQQPVDARKVRNWFARFAKRHAQAKRSGAKVRDGGLMMSWDLWGGDAMRKQVERADARASSSKRKANPCGSKRKANPGAKRPTVAKLTGAGVELGPLREIVYESGGKLYRMHWGGAQPVLWWNPEHRILAAVNGAEAPKRRSVDPFTLPAKSVRVYEAFHGRDVTGARVQSLPAGELHKLGRAVSIAYRSNKRAGGGTGRMVTYEHEFAPSDVVWSQKNRGASLVAVTGPRLTVNDRGIVY